MKSVLSILLFWSYNLCAQNNVYTTAGASPNMGTSLPGGVAKVVLGIDTTTGAIVKCWGCGTGGSSGTVTSFSAGTLSPLFTTGVATSTTTPALSFTLSNAGSNTVFANISGGSAAPAFTSAATVINAGLPLTTAGDILYENGTPTPARLAIGSSTQVLTVVSGLPAWQPAVGFSNPMTTSQDLIVGGSSGAAGRLGVGSNNQVLTVVSGSVAWATPTTGFTNPMTTAGDIIVGGTSGAAQRLGVGSNGNILTVSSGTEAWATGATLFVQNQNSAVQASSNFYISGTGRYSNGSSSGFTFENVQAAAATGGGYLDANNRMILFSSDAVDSGGNVAVGNSSLSSYLVVKGQVYRHDTAVTANYTAGSTDYYIEASASSGGFTITLPSAATFRVDPAGYPDFRTYAAELVITRTDNTSANTLTIAAHSGETINGNSSITIAPGGSIEIHATGSTAWWID